MKVKEALFVFRFLLRAKQWYIIAENESQHIKIANIETGKLLQAIKTDTNDFLQGERLVNEANNLIKF
jgi:hypothetical protein